MENRWRETFLEWSKSDEFQAKVQQATEIIRNALTERNVYSTFSGGKDSLVVSHMANLIKPGILVLHIDYGKYLIPRPIHKEIRKIAKEMNWNFEIYAHPIFRLPPERTIGVMGIVLSDLAKHMQEKGYDGVFVGLRSAESTKRKQRIKTEFSLTAIKEYYPVSNWSWLDIWAYIVSRELPYLWFYDRYAKVLGWENARFTTMFDPEFEKFGAPAVDGVLSPRWRR